MGLDELLNEASGAQNSQRRIGVPQVQMTSSSMGMSPVAAAQTLSPTQMSSQVHSAQPLLVTQMAQLTSVKQMVVMRQTMQSGQTGQYDPSAQPILPLLMTQSPDASAQATSQVQTGGQGSGGTQQDIMSENRQLHEENQKLLVEKQNLLADKQKSLAENQKLLADNSLLKLGNEYFMKRIQELKLKVDELKLKLKGQVCLLAGRFYIYMVVMKCFIYIWLWRILYILDYLCL